MKRATSSGKDLSIIAIISIHALVKRATKDEFISCDYKANFNPRPREEGDYDFKVTKTAPKDFNPRPREEGDLLKDFIVANILIFQSTPS